MQFLCVILLLVASFLSEASGDNTGNTLYLAVYDNLNKATYVIWLSANPEPYKNNVTLDYDRTYVSFNHHFTAIFADYETGNVTFHDQENHWIYLTDSFTEPNGMADSVAGGTSGRVDGLTIDHLAKNVYWVDEGYNWIKMTNYTGGGLTIIIDAGLERPSDIACHPHMGYLFWTDLGNLYPPKIERSSMSGKNRTTIVTDVGVPVSITVDINENRIYWIDHSETESKIESSDLDGNNRRLEVSQSLSLGAFSDISVDEDYIFVSVVTLFESLIRYYNKATPVTLTFEYNFGLFIDIFDVHVTGPNVQPKQETLPCNSRPCDHYCVSAANDNYECVCREYFGLYPNNTCVDLNLIKLQPPYCVIGRDESISRFDPRLLHYDLQSKQRFVSDILKGNRQATAVAVDTHSNQLFYADDRSKSIYVVRLVDGQVPRRIHSSIGRVDGMAVDWLSLKLYWVDHDNNHLKFSNYDGSSSIVIIYDIVQPRAIAVDPLASLIFWTEISSPAKLVRSDYGGSNRRVIVDTYLQTPSGITLDYQHEIIYIVDESIKGVYYSSYDGLAQGIFTESIFPAIDVTLFQDFLLLAQKYYVDLGLIEKIHKITGEHEGMVSLNSSVFAIDIVDESRQPLIRPNVTGTPPAEALTTISSKITLDQFIKTPSEEALTTISSMTTLDQTILTTTKELVANKATTLEKDAQTATSPATYGDVGEEKQDNSGSTNDDFNFIVIGSIGAAVIITILIVIIIVISLKRSVPSGNQGQDRLVDHLYASHIPEGRGVQNTTRNIENDILPPPTPKRPEFQTPGSYQYRYESHIPEGHGVENTTKSIENDIFPPPTPKRHGFQTPAPEYFELTPNSKTMENVFKY